MDLCPLRGSVAPLPHEYPQFGGGADQINVALTLFETLQIGPERLRSSLHFLALGDYIY